MGYLILLNVSPFLAAGQISTFLRPVYRLAVPQTHQKAHHQEVMG